MALNMRSIQSRMTGSKDFDPTDWINNLRDVNALSEFSADEKLLIDNFLMELEFELRKKDS